MYDLSYPVCLFTILFTNESKQGQEMDALLVEYLWLYPNITEVTYLRDFFVSVVGLPQSIYK